MTKTARVIVTLKCVRNCSYCVNKQRGNAVKWNAVPLLDIYDLEEFDTILLTGGEPLLEQGLTESLITRIRRSLPGKQIILYLSANLLHYTEWQKMFGMIDGVTYTLHNDPDDARHEEDLEGLVNFQMIARGYTTKSFRLNLAPDLVDMVPIMPMVWKQIKIKEWVDDCPTPEGETLFKVV